MSAQRQNTGGPPGQRPGQGGHAAGDGQARPGARSAPEPRAAAETGTAPDGTAPLVVVTGVSGSGKSTVGRMLAARLALPYADADDFHPPGNVAKMSAGQPLNDEDRRPWLEAIAAWLSEHADGGGVVTSSALKRRYRDRLAKGAPGRVFFLHLDGPEELIAERVTARTDHFMPRSLLRSQFETLEPLETDEPGAVVSVDGTREEVTARALAALGKRP